MKKIYSYLWIVVLFACNSAPKTEVTTTASSDTISAVPKKCFCDTDGNLNLIPDLTRDERMQRWHNKIAALYPNIPAANLPKGFRISVQDVKSMSEFLNTKNPQPTSVIAYFGFDTDGAADSGRVTAVFVPQYAQGVSFPPCRKGCKHLDDANVADSTQRNINLDLTQPCPPFCGN